MWSDKLFAARTRRCLLARGAAMFGAALAVLILGGGQALATSAGCTALNGYMLLKPGAFINAWNFSANDIIKINAYYLSVNTYATVDLYGLPTANSTSGASLIVQDKFQYNTKQPIPYTVTTSTKGGFQLSYVSFQNEEPQGGAATAEIQITCSGP